MARKSAKQLETESALNCLNSCAEGAKENGETFWAYHCRNEPDTSRWIRTLKQNGAPCPAYIQNYPVLRW